MLKVLVGDFLECLPDGIYYMIEWCGFDIYVFSFFDKISIKRTHFTNDVCEDGCYLIPRDLVRWLRNQRHDTCVELRIIRDEDGDSLLKCIINDGKCIQSFRCPVETRASIEWEDSPEATVDWTSDMISAVKCLSGLVHVDMHIVVKFASGHACAVVELPVVGESSCVYSSKSLQNVDIVGKMCIHQSKVMEIKSDRVVYLIAPSL